MRKIVWLLIFIFFPIMSFASKCDVFSKINEAGLSDNAEFWSEFANLSSKGEVPEAEISRLMNKYQASPKSITLSREVKVSDATTQSKGFLAGTQRTEIRKTAEKGYSKAPLQVQHKADELVELFNEKGGAAIHELKQHNWNYEYIDGQKKYSVRLSQGYRAMITVDGDKLTVWNIGKHDVYTH